MGDLNLLLNGFRFAAGLPGFLRKSITLEEARDTVRRRLEARGSNFLRMVETSVFGYAKSPYRRLFAQAGCEFGDLEASVGRDGLEGTLRRLRQEGVYVGFEEFKGRRPIKRGTVCFDVRAADFDNPYLRKAIARPSSGSSGRATRSLLDLEYLADQAPRPDGDLRGSRHPVLPRGAVASARERHRRPPAAGPFRTDPVQMVHAFL